MPTSVDKLTKQSSKGQIQAAISECIATEMHNGGEQSQAIAMCHAMSREKTGKELTKKGA